MRERQLLWCVARKQKPNSLLSANHIPRFHVATRMDSFLRDALCLAPIVSTRACCTECRHYHQSTPRCTALATAGVDSVFDVTHAHKKKVFSKHGLPHTLTTGEHVSTHTDTRRGIQQHTAIARGKIRGGNIVGTSQPTIPPKLPDGVCPQNWPFFFNEKVVNTVKITGEKTRGARGQDSNIEVIHPQSHTPL